LEKEKRKNYFLEFWPKRSASKWATPKWSRHKVVYSIASQQWKSFGQFK